MLTRQTAVPMRLTKIICTLGPATHSVERIEALANAGMNIARINLSHGTGDDHRAIIANVKGLRERGHCIALMIDTRGAEIRTGDVRAPLHIAEKQEVVFATHPLPDEERTVITVDHNAFAADVRGARCILIDNGDMSFDIVDIRGDGSVIARARESGAIGSRRHVNLPGADPELPSITQKDLGDLALGVEENVDFVALSFIRTGDAVREVKAFLDENGSTMQVIAKIETERAVQNFNDILQAADGIMVARGDLGAEIPFELVPAIQDDIVQRCREAGKPVIVATHMLESMIKNPMPTRAEVTDVAHAALTRADCTMLSGETAVGQHPLAAVQAMDRILRETETHLPQRTEQKLEAGLSEHAARAGAAATMAATLQAPAIVVLTRSGRSAQSISPFRPTIPIIALTDTEEVQRSMQMLYGVHPLRIDFHDDPETTVEAALLTIRSEGLLKSGQRIVVVSDAKTKSGIVSTIQMRTIP